MILKYVPSVSRSSGLEDQGDALTSHEMQHDYHKFIQEKLENYWEQYTPDSHIAGTVNSKQRESQSNILILFRKLREGLIASNRVDNFALKVYETSLHLSVLFRSTVQTTSIIAHLLPQRASCAAGFYDAYSRATGTIISRPPPSEIPLMESTDVFPGPGEVQSCLTRVKSCQNTQHEWTCRQGDAHGTSDPHVQFHQTFLAGNISWSLPHTCLPTLLLSLLHTLLHSYPSRSAFNDKLKAYQQHLNREDINRWLKSMLTALESRNYIRFERLSRPSEVEAILRSLASASSKGHNSTDLDICCIALKLIVADLREKAQESAWAVLRMSYRELDVTQSAEWLLRLLMHNTDVTGAGGGAVTAAHNWLCEKPASEVRKKTEGLKGCWVLCRGK